MSGGSRAAVWGGRAGGAAAAAGAAAAVGGGSGSATTAAAHRSGGAVTGATGVVWPRLRLCVCSFCCRGRARLFIFFRRPPRRRGVSVAYRFFFFLFLSSLLRALCPPPRPSAARAGRGHLSRSAAHRRAYYPRVAAPPTGPPRVLPMGVASTYPSRQR